MPSLQAAPVSLGQRLLGAVRQTFGAADASDVSRLIGRIPKDGDGLIFRRALHEAITVFKEPEWTMAFVDDSIGSSSFNFYGLVSSLSREEQERFARKSWDDSGRSRANVFLQFAVTSQPWSREFTTWFIPAIVAESKLERPRLYPGSLYSAALKMDLEAAHIPNVELKPEFEQLFEHWRQVIALRRSIRHSFPSPSKS
ncbi:hypothetical protein EON79_04150 [bacterium]|nr:MAG: hypothetical protein EON79_04150 [bacterium]